MVDAALSHRLTKINPEAETWRPVVGYEHMAYEVSTKGRVRNRRGRLLSQTIAQQGYPQVTLYRDSQDRSPVMVHRLMARAFIGPAVKGYCVNHIDGIKINNDIVNLEYVTIAENTRHAILIGISCSRTNGRLRSKLTEEDVREIRSIGNELTDKRELAKQFGVSRRTIRDILSRQVWAAVQQDA